MIIVLFVALVLCAISFIVVTNVMMFPRLSSSSDLQLTVHPFISVMIPARNEAAIIAQTLYSLLSQRYPQFEVILLDDNSTDQTGEIAKQNFEHDPRLMVIQGKTLPHGWVGKNWACHQMAEIAKGDYLVFTDADVQWKPEALQAAAAYMLKTKADLFSVWPTQKTISWAERLCVPLMALVVLGYLPILGTHNVPLSIFGAANGQCMIWRREAYSKVGGHLNVRATILEDVTLARKVKSGGLRMRMADGNNLITCRMYSDWLSVRNGYAKNILAGYGDSLILLVLATIFHWLIFLFPWLWLLTGWVFENAAFYPSIPLALIAIGLLIRALTAAFTHQRILDAFLLPVSVLLMTRIALQSIWWHYRYGGPHWKGRIVHQEHATYD